MRMVECLKIKTEEIVVLKTFQKCKNKEETHSNQNTLYLTNKYKHNMFK